MASEFLEGKLVELSFQNPSENIQISINSLIVKILSRCNLKYLIDTCITITREIVLNAFKANAKRVFFKQKGLDIHNPALYKKGMREFKKVITDITLLNEEVMKSSFRIGAIFKKTDLGILISISNNCPLTGDEKERILKRIYIAINGSEFSSIYSSVYDSIEGAGLGIIISLLLLKNAGIDPQLFKLKDDENSTVFEFTIPFEPRKISDTSAIKLKIINEIESLPTFPQYIVELQSLCDDPKSKIHTIASKILTDPSLTADVLKISNSAGFITGKRIDSITDAIIIIGMKNLKSILITTATRRILDKRYKRYEGIWDHCNKAGFYARAIAEVTGHARLADQVFLAGLLHDIGKIALLAADEKLANQIIKALGNKRVSTSPMLEEISIGISHATIGKLIAEKWNFPEYITNAIEYHHSPLNAPGEYQDVVTIVYLANMLCEIEKQHFDISYIETQILENLRLTDRKDFNAFFNTIITRYNSHHSSLKG